jgi:hypothetical protein
MRRERGRGREGRGYVERIAGKIGGNKYVVE